MVCKGVCDRYKALKPTSGGRYQAGQKRCQICSIYIHFNGLSCPCCRYRLRNKPRNVKYKAKLEKAKNEKNIYSFGISMDDDV